MKININHEMESGREERRERNIEIMPQSTAVQKNCWRLNIKQAITNQQKSNLFNSLTIKKNKLILKREIFK